MRHQEPRDVAAGLVGLLLEQAFMRARSSGCVLNVVKIDGVPHGASVPSDSPIINVVIEDGVVKQSYPMSVFHGV